jgi:hypothetical protein
MGFYCITTLAGQQHMLEFLQATTTTNARQQQKQLKRYRFFKKPAILDRNKLLLGRNSDSQGT